MRTKKELNYKVWEEFPTPLFTVNIPQIFSNAIEFLDTLPSKDILSNEQLKELSLFILQTSLSYSEQLLLHKPINISLLESRILNFKSKNNIIIKGDKNSYLSGIFYYGEGDINNPHAQFHNPNNYLIETDNFESQYTVPFRTIIFKPGRLILYPSYLNVSFSKNKNKKNINYLSFKIKVNVQEK